MNYSYKHENFNQRKKIYFYNDDVKMAPSKRREATPHFEKMELILPRYTSSKVNLMKVQYWNYHVRGSDMYCTLKSISIMQCIERDACRPEKAKQQSIALIKSVWAGTINCRHCWHIMINKLNKFPHIFIQIVETEVLYHCCGKWKVRLCNSFLKTSIIWPRVMFNRHQKYFILPFFCQCILPQCWDFTVLLAPTILQGQAEHVQNSGTVHVIAMFCLSRMSPTVKQMMPWLHNTMSANISPYWPF